MTVTGRLPARISSSRLRLVVAANVRLPVRTAVRSALAFVLLGQCLRPHLVVIVRHLASVGKLFVARILFMGHGVPFKKITDVGRQTGLI